MSTAPTLTIPSRDLAAFSHSGARFLQCPHQGAMIKKTNKFSNKKQQTNTFHNEN